MQRLELPLTSNDYSGNVRPDGHFAPELDLGILQNSVGRDSAIVKNFTSFSSDDKLIICDFIEKHRPCTIMKLMNMMSYSCF